MSPSSRAARSKSEAELYPDDDGNPMSDNTLQFRWIVTLQGALDALFADRPDVFVAGDLLWYAVEGDPKARTAPDAMVAFGRPKGYRGSYKQWVEGGIPPQVVFEVLSPGNRRAELARKLAFYDRHGVEEYYQYDPDRVRLKGWLRIDGDRLAPIAQTDGWVSPRLGVRFDMSGAELVLYRPDGRPFATYQELAEQSYELAEQRDELAEQRDRLTEQRDELSEQRDRLTEQRDAERRRAEEQARRAEEQALRAEQLAQRLRELGFDPE